MTHTEIIKLRLFNQQITSTRFTKPEEVINWLGAMQAQEYAMAKWAIGMRLENVYDDAIEKEFNDGRILRTHVLRPTWHFVSPKDIRWIINLTAPRVNAANAFMYRQTELNDQLFTRANSIIAKSLEGGKYLTREDLQKVLAHIKIEAKGIRLAYIMMRAELDGIICSGPRIGNQFTYALLDERVPAVRQFDKAESLAELSRRFFTSRGPASVNDFAYWSGLAIKEAKEGLEMIKKDFDEIKSGGVDYYFIPHDLKKLPMEQSSFLMADYDEYGMSYKNSGTFYVDFSESDKMIEKFTYNRLLVIDGYFKGSWKRSLSVHTVNIEIDPVVKLTTKEVKKATLAAEKFAAFLQREPKINVTCL